jgi:hypothetical protein
VSSDTTIDGPPPDLDDDPPPCREPYIHPVTGIPGVCHRPAGHTGAHFGMLYYPDEWSVVRIG